MENKCTLCPRECNVCRAQNILGVCGVNNEYKIGRIAPHYYEEPSISGTKGSGAIFFSGCNMGCIYCQNELLSKGVVGRYYSENELINAILSMQADGVHNINLVTPSHYVDKLSKTLKTLKKEGLKIPVVYNTSSYEKVEALKQLDGLIDIYLPDLKYLDTYGSSKYSKAPDYPEIAKLAIAEMVRQVGRPLFEDGGRNAFSEDDSPLLIKKGVIVRHLVLPGRVNESKDVIKYLYDTYKDDIYISIMNQYTPYSKAKEDKDLCRTITEEEYDEVIDYALSIGIENGFIQEGETQDESFIPEFSSKIE